MTLQLWQSLVAFSILCRDCFFPDGLLQNHAHIDDTLLLRAEPELRTAWNALGMYSKVYIELLTRLQCYGFATLSVTDRKTSTRTPKTLFGVESG